MAKGHWLDPLARKILRATGHLPNKTIKNTAKEPGVINSIENEFVKLKRKYSDIHRKPSFTIDVNRATSSDWRQLPGCTDEMVELLLRLQRGGVQLSGNEDLVKLLELPYHIAEDWKPYLIFRWYGSPPNITQYRRLDINQATHSNLKAVLNWPEERLIRLIKERQIQPFDDLADLQERLILPAPAIEALIGNVRFGSKPTGPILPPGR